MYLAPRSNEAYQRRSVTILVCQGRTPPLNVPHSIVRRLSTACLKCYPSISASVMNTYSTLSNSLSWPETGCRPNRTKSRQNESRFRSNGTWVFVLSRFRSDGFTFYRDCILIGRFVSFWLSTRYTHHTRWRMRVITVLNTK